MAIPRSRKSLAPFYAVVICLHPRPLFPQKQTFVAALRTSAKCHKQTSTYSLDHLVGAAEQREREGEPECFGGLEIDSHLDSRDLLHR
jgi:hypothetical protein